MTNVCDEELHEWKKCWQQISGIHFETPQRQVLERLRTLSGQLIDGLKPTKKPSAEQTKQAKDACPKDWLPFVEMLHHYINVDFIEANRLFSYYLIYEYRGSTSSLAFYLSTEGNMTKLLDDIWDYHTLDRMFKLKVVRNLLEHYKSTKHIYATEYNKIVNELKLPNIRQSYVEQFELLLKDVPPAKFTNAEVLNSQCKLTAWSERRCREMIEVLQIILLCVDADWIVPAQLSKLVELFKYHLLGRQTQYLNGTNRQHQDLIQKLTYSQVALFMKCAEVRHCSLPAEVLAECRRLIDNEVIGWYQYAEHGPLLLAWMLFAFADGSLLDDEDAQRKYRQFGTRATQLGVFGYLHSMCAHPMYDDKSYTAMAVRRSVYNLLCMLCDLFDEDGTVARYPGVYELCAELLKTPAIARDFCADEESGIRSLYNTALENFGVDFVSLSSIVNALAVSMPRYNLNEQLTNLPMYSEIYGGGERYQLKALTDTSGSDVLLMDDYFPFRHIDYRIPAGTHAVIVDRGNIETIHFRHRVNYYNVLHHEIDELLANAQSTEIDGDRIRRVTAGLKYLAVALSRIDNAADITADMVHPVEMVFDVLLKFKVSPMPPIELLANCLRVCEALLPLYRDEILKRIVNLNILPYVTNETLDYRAYVTGVNFSSAVVGHLLINFEKQLGKYDFLMAYLSFIKACSRNKSINNTTMTIEMPALLFLLQEVFAYVHTWRFENEADRQVVYKIVMDMFFDVLVTDDEQHRPLRNVCVYSLLNCDNGMILLKFIAMGNDFLNTSMQNESNWLTASFAGFHGLIQQTMKILMKILKLKSQVFHKSDTNPTNNLTPLETLIYTQPKQRDTLRIIPVVTNYMNNTFNSRVPVLACRLLCAFAFEFRMSLLACLDLEPYQIRLTFLMRLCDDMESDNLKMAVIEFVEACINTQPGLTEVFFKVVYKRENRFLPKISKTKDIAEGIQSYMQECLAAVRADSNVIVSPLLGRIMSLFHALWKNGMQSLVQDLVDAEDFWPSLLSPLYTNRIVLDIQTYSQLFNIVGVELFRCSPTGTMDDRFRKSIEKFFQPPTFQSWIDAILDLPHIQNEEQSRRTGVAATETPEWLSRLQSFKDMIVIMIRKPWHRIAVPDKCHTYLADRCLATLVERAENTDDFRPFIVLSELYLVLLLLKCNAKSADRHVNELRAKQIAMLLNTLSGSYREIHVRAKESILTVAFKSMDFSATDTDESISSDFIRSICEILCHEISLAEAEFGETNTDRPHLPFLLSVNLLKKIITKSDRSASYFHLVSNKICHRVLACLNVTLPMYEWRKVSLELLQLLIVLAESDCSAELLHCDIGHYLWLKLLPPRDLLRGIYATASQTMPVKWQTNDWWPIYEHGIRFVTIMLQRHKFFVLKEALLFVGLHEEYLMDSIMLAKTTMNRDAMPLIRTALEFAAELLVYERQWRLDHVQSMMTLMRSVQLMLDHAVSLLYRPRYLRQLVDGVSSSPPKTNVDTLLSSSLLTSTTMVKSMNNVIEIVTISIKCLLAFSPKLINLMTDIEFSTIEWQPLVEIQFGAPNLNVNTSVPQLTFGTIVSAACILTKALNLKKYSFSDTRLDNIADTSIDLSTDSLLDESVDRTVSSPPTGAKRSHRWDSASTSSSPHQTTHSTFRSTAAVPLLKSLSTSSASSGDHFNELLINLDSRQCVIALEYVMTLLASQSLLALKDVHLSSREKQLIKRELNTELSIVFEFVKKQVTVSSDVAVRNAPFYRQKYPVIPLTNDENDSDGASAEACSSQNQRHRTPASGSDAMRKSMRVQLVRKLHAQKTPPASRSEFELSRNISPIGVSTPKKSSLNLPSSTPIVRESEHSSDEIAMLEPIEPTYTGLSMIKLVDKDYLHLISNIFQHIICQSD